MPPTSTELERSVDPLRPTTLSEFTGQPTLAVELGVILSAARSRGQVPGHLLFAGPPGLGKTTLAHIVGSESGLPVVATSGPALDKPGDLAALLVGLESPAVVFIDEIHRLPRVSEELLYPAMEDGLLEITVGGDGTPVQAVRLPLVPFTLIGATTQAGMLSSPLRDRFSYTGRLTRYEVDALAHIVHRAATMLDLTLDEQGCVQLASRSRGTPRVANKLLGLVRDHVDAAGERPDLVDEARVLAAMEAFGIDSLGLDRLARDILTRLCTDFGGGPVGVSTLAAAVGEAPRTLEEVWEPYLMHAGLLARTPRGRVATVKAFEHLDLDVPISALGTATPDLFDPPIL